MLLKRIKKYALSVPPISNKYRININIITCYLSGFFIVAFLYSAFLLPGAQEGSALILYCGFVTLFLHVVTEMIRPSQEVVRFRPAGYVSLAFLSVSAVGACASSLLRYQEVGFEAKDVATLFFVSLAPFLLIFANRRSLVMALCQWAVVFALADAIANFLSLAGLYELATYSGRLDESGQRLRYPGLSGSTLGSGIVAFLAVAHLADRTRRNASSRYLFAALVLIVLCSMVLIDARRYLGVSLVAVVLLWWPRRTEFRPVYIIVPVAFIFLYATFTADAFDAGNQLRASLMKYGWDLAWENAFLGTGVFYVDQSNLVPTFDSLASAGVVESQILEMLRDFGVLFTLFWILAICIVSFFRHGLYSIFAILMSLFAAELAYGSPLRGPLGSVVFYACFLILMEANTERAGQALRSPRSREL